MGRKRGRMVDGAYVEEELDEPAAQVDVRADGSLRRPGAGGRTISEMFHPDNLRREMTRQDYLNVRSVEEYHRRECVWWRRLYRFVRGWPQVSNMNAVMANSHARSLDSLRGALVKRANEEQDRQGRAIVDAMVSTAGPEQP